MTRMSHVIRPLFELSEETFLDSYSTSKTALQRMNLTNRYTTPEYQKGKTTELLVRELLLTCFHGVADVYLTPRGSRADDDMKVDLVVRTEGGYLFGFQVKSSETGARMHLEKNSDVPVMWIDPDNRVHRLAFVKDIAEYMAFYLEYKDEVLAVWETRRRLVQGGVYTLPKAQATAIFTTDGKRILTLLGLAYEKAGQFIFGKPKE